MPYVPPRWQFFQWPRCSENIYVQYVVDSSDIEKRPEVIPARGAWLLSNMLSVIILFSTHGSAQDLNAKNEVGAWFSGQFASSQAIGSTINTRMYQFGGRYARLIYANRTLAVRYVAAVVPICAVGDPSNNGQPVYAYAAGASPIAIQLNWLHSGRLQPFLTTGGGFLYFNRQLFHATQFNFTAQAAVGLQVLISEHHSVDFGYRYHHISNANLGTVNPGMDSHVLFVGFSFLR